MLCNAYHKAVKLKCSDGLADAAVAFMHPSGSYPSCLKTRTNKQAFVPTYLLAPIAKKEAASLAILWKAQSQPMFELGRAGKYEMSAVTSVTRSFVWLKKLATMC